MSLQPTKFSKESLVMQRAQKAVLARDYQAAIRLYVRLLKAEPNNKDVLMHLADVYVLAGDDANALKIFTTILKNEPSNFKALNSLSGIYRRMGKLDESLEVINTLKKSGLNKDEVEFNAGYTYKLMGKYDEALSAFYNALEKNPGDVLAYNHIGSIEDLRGNNEKALAAFSRGLQVDPNNPVLHYNTAMHFVKQNDTDKAAQHFESALKANAGWGDALNQYSDLLVRSGTEERAEELLLKNIRLNPQNTTAYNKLGRLYSDQQKYDKAEAIYLKVLDFDSENMAALSGLGTVYDRQKKYFDAAAILERLGKLQTDDLPTALRYAKILIELKRLQEAAVLLKKLYIREPNDIPLLNILAQYFVRSKDFKKAYVCFKRISRIAPDECDFLKENAVQFMYVKAFVNAERLLQSYIKKRPDDPEAWAYLAKCYEARKLYKKSLSALQHCMKLDKNNFSAIELLGDLSRSLSGDPEATNIIAELLNKTVNAEGNLDTLLNSMEARENILNHITKPDTEDDKESSDTEEDADDIQKNTEIEFFDSDEEENEFLQLDFLAPDAPIEDDYNPLDLIQAEDETAEDPSNESFSFSDLLAPDMPVEYDRSRDGDLSDSPFDLPYSQKYDPSEEESVIDIDGAGFEAEDFEDDEENPDGILTLPQNAEVPVSEKAEHAGNAAPLPPKHEASPVQQAADCPLPPETPQNFPNPAPVPETMLEDAADIPLEEDEEPEETIDIPVEEPEDSDEETETENGEKTDNDEDLTIDEELMQQMREVLTNVFEKPPIKEFSRTFEMFNSLRGLCSYLPTVKKDEFFSDLNRVKLDYVIDRLQGRPGLLAAAEALHTRGFIKPKEDSGDKKQPLKSTLTFMNSLVEKLPDKGHAHILHTKIDSVISGLDGRQDSSAHTEK